MSLEMTERFMRWNRTAGATLLLAGLSASSVAAPELSVQMFHKNKYIMGTVFDVVVYDTSAAHAEQAMNAVLEEIVRLDWVMSDYKPESELSKLNRSAHNQRQTVSPDLYRVISESLPYSKLSGGKFDVTIAPLADRWKAALRGEAAPSVAEQQALRECVGYEKVQMIPPNQIEFHSPCLRIDLGSIGKGYAVDRAAEILRVRGIKNALIDAGGSTFYGMGAPPGRAGWLVHLRDPSQKIDPQVLLCENSASTSEQTAKSLLGNEAAGHIIDPADGGPLKTRYALSVVTKTGTASDALSTTLLLVGPEKGKGLVQGMKDTAAIWLSAEGHTEMATSGPRILLGPSSGNPSVAEPGEKPCAAEN
jgi:thiamine biosynthesis lipoprotein